MLPWSVNMPTQNLMRLLLLLMRIMLATVCCRFEAEVCYLQFKMLFDRLMRTQSHLKRAFTCLVSELVSNPIGYFGKINSTLGSVVPLAMFDLNGDHLYSHEATTRLSDRPIWIRLGGNIGIDGVCNIIRGGASKQNNRMMKVTRQVILMILKSNQRIIINFLNQYWLKCQNPLPCGKANTFQKNEGPNAIILRDFIFQCKICRRIVNWIGHRIWKKNLDGI